jgi:flagellar basal-body rod protein FlgC
MDYLQIFDISHSGLSFQRLRMDTIATNLANAQATRSADGTVFRPLEAVAVAGQAGQNGASFDSVFAEVAGVEQLSGIASMEIREKASAPRLVFDPGHPDANQDGFVEMPNVNPVDEMSNLITATRAYEANIRVMNAAKTLALRTLEIWRNK